MCERQKKKKKRETTKRVQQQWWIKKTNVYNRSETLGEQTDGIDKESTDGRNKWKKTPRETQKIDVIDE